MEFDARDQLQALAALPPEPPKPAAPKTSAWSAPFRALPAGVAEIGAMVAEATKASGQALDSTGTAGAGGMFGGQTDAERAQSERMREQIRTRGLQGGSEVSRSLRNVAEGYGPDPLTASKAEQIVFGLTKGVSKAVGYGLTTGPAAPLLFGLDEGLTETDRLQRQGVDNVTAGRVGMVAGGVNAAGMALPVAGATVRQTAALATLGGPASFVAQQMASREILSRADYHDIAATFDPLDPWGLALSSLPYGFGAWAMRSRMRGAPVRAPVRDQAPADGAAGVADTRPTPEPVRPVEAPPMERTPVAHAVQEAMPREAVDAAMVQHITDASQFMRVWESPPVESLASFAARTLPEAAPVRAAAGPDPFLVWLRAQGGVNFADKFDITGEANAIRSNRGGVFRKGGRGIDELAQAAEAEGWLPPGTVADVDGGTPQMRDMIQRAMQGERIAPLADQFAGLEARGRAHADEMRAAEMEQRLRLLGEDPTPARGNVDVLQAYLDQHEPRLLAAALADARTRDTADLPEVGVSAIRGRLRAQLEASGRPADEAAAGAALVSRWYEVQASRAGMAPQELAARYPLRIQAKAGQGSVLDQGERSKATDAEYLAAIERGDMGAAQKMVDQAARAAGYISAAEYRMAHLAPNSQDNTSLANLRGEGLVPADYWEKPEWYQTSPEEMESWRKVKSLFSGMDKRGNPGLASMTVYRSVPKDVKDGSIRNGDWVTPSLAYAKLEGESIPGGYKIISQQASAKNLYWDGNSIAELGYDDGQNYAYKNTKNNRKLIDAITRDDNGNVVPLSKRFNSRSAEVFNQFAGPGAVAQPARGQISFGQDLTQAPSVISLFKSADASTFLHESGHFFLEAQLDMAARLGDEAGTIKADAQTLLDWFGVKSPDEWAAMSIDQKRPHHERFAQAFERYLADGKAPAPGLQGLFDQLAQWLKAVYRDITGLGAEITPEVRAVMDRMLATDQEIDAARQTTKGPDGATTTPNPAQEASPAPRPQEPALPPIEPGSGPDHAAIQSVRTRANQVVTEAPDLVVGRTEDGQPITAREALERIRQEAQAGTEDTLGAAEAGLLDVAVQCALSLGG